MRFTVIRPLIWFLAARETGAILEIRLQIPDSEDAKKVLMHLAMCQEIDIDIRRRSRQGTLFLVGLTE